MKKSRIYLLIRAGWYLAGFILFYAPFAFFQKLLISVFNVSGNKDVHGSCFRMVVQKLFTGGGIEIKTTSAIIVLLVLISALLLGPIFCGKFCISGAISEYVSRIVPNKIKINWSKYIDQTPVRYGILAGFLIAPFMKLSVMCAYCNYSILQTLIQGGISWNLKALGSTTILTGFIWLIVLGAFTKGGRGYCSYLCPIGAVQSLIHSIGARLPFTFKLKYSADKCVSCNLCVKDCPMNALKNSGNGLQYNIHSCITCQQCKHVCPKNAITYGYGKSNWNLNNENDIRIIGKFAKEGKNETI
ncbi:MAG: 4Fe-4S binding protein [Bacillota bacterium]|nr:4Fe-4S binding protein [Bacillota bacterium]